MAELQDISVLIIDDSLEEISRISSVLDNSGFRVRSFKAETKDELVEQLNTAQFDIILIKRDSEPLTPKLLLQTLKRLDKDIPALVLTNALDGRETAEYIRMGAKDMIAEDEDQHMVTVISRELKNKADRTAFRSAQRKLSSAENRYQELLEFSKLPLAIVQESMFVLANESFCDLFELDREDTLALPVIDILDKQSRQSFKELYKRYLKSPENFVSEEINTEFTDSLNETKTVSIQFNTVKYQDEDSLQLKIDSQELIQATNNGEIYADLSGSIPRHRMTQFIENCIGLASSDSLTENHDSCLACIEIDGFDSIQEAQGIGLTDELHNVFQIFVSEYFAGKPLCAFDSNKILVLFEAEDQNTVVPNCKELCQKVEDQVFEFGEHSQQITCTIGVALISELVTNTDSVIKRSLKACEQILETKENGIGNTAALYEPEAAEIEHEAIDINYLIKQAFKHDHLQLLFQPLLNFHGDSGKHYEVLLGVKPEHKEAYPGDFITMATRSNENLEIDKWVILESMRTLMKREVCDGDESLYIHVGKQSLGDSKFMSWVKAAIDKSKINPGRLTFQLREPDVSPNLKLAADMAKTISKLGCKSVITNFGSSVQPMKVLENITFDYAKVDMSFAMEAQNSSEGAEKLTSLLDNIASAGIPAIVPCIESAAVLPILWNSNVAYIQGFYVQPPSPVMDYTP